MSFNYVSSTAVCFATLEHEQPWSLEAYLASGGYQAWKRSSRRRPTRR